MAAIIRTLWGCDGPEYRWRKVWKDVEWQLQKPCYVQQYVYVYGKENAKRLRALNVKNIEIVLVDKSPFPDGMRDHKRTEKGTPIRPWHYKHELLLKAIEDHGEIFYCDWDVSCYVKDIEQALSHIEGRDLVLSATRYYRKRFMYRGGDNSLRFGVSGNWLFTRNSKWCERVLKVMKGKEPWAWHDEYVMTRIIDEDNGGWAGEANWLLNWESPIMIQKSTYAPWEIISETEFEIKRASPVPFTWYKLFGQFWMPPE